MEAGLKKEQEIILKPRIKPRNHILPRSSRKVIDLDHRITASLSQVGQYVGKVDEGSPAWLSGMKEHDRIGEKVHSRGVCVGARCVRWCEVCALVRGVCIGARCVCCCEVCALMFVVVKGLPARLSGMKTNDKINERAVRAHS